MATSCLLLETHATTSKIMWLIFTRQPRKPVTRLRLSRLEEETLLRRTKSKICLFLFPQAQECVGQVSLTVHIYLRMGQHAKALFLVPSSP